MLRARSLFFAENVAHNPGEGLTNRRPVPALSRILVVDDDDDARALMKELLEGSGYAVSLARDGLAALELLTKKLDPSLVILDWEMPVMSGGELLSAMKADERLSRLAVLIVSGSVKSIACKDAAVVGFVPKPLDVDELISNVNKTASTTVKTGDVSV